MHRLAREYRTQEHLIIYLASKGLTLISADTGEDITAAMMGDPMRRALVQIQGIFAELEKNMLVVKLKKARERKRKTTGKCEGTVPFGGKPEEVEALERIIEWRAMGNSYRKIAEALDYSGLRTRSGKPWRKTTVALIVKRVEAA
jgi:DNA invertase Pin-like site-specific DNA recombinase